METDKSDLLAHYATKEDVAGVRIEMKEMRGELRAELQAFRGEFRAELQALRSEMREGMQILRNEMLQMGRDIERAMHAQTWKMVGLVLAVNAATVTAVYHIAN